MLSAARILLVLAVASGSAMAQMTGPHDPIDPQLDCDRRYVDPVGGDNTFTGTLARPWRTLTHALVNTMKPGVVILLPGIYSSSTNGETFPVFLRNGISIQGTSALNTILDGEGNDVIWVHPFGPNDTFVNTLVDAVTITNGEAGVRFVDELLSVEPEFANCFIVKNAVGVHLTAIYCHMIQPDGYIKFRPKFVNDTIAENGIGILDEGIWFSFDPDPDLTVNGEAEPAIVNCLVWPNTLSDLEGVDGTDISRTVFCTSDQAGISQIRSNKPAPASLIPVCGGNPDSVYVNRVTWDYRLLPGSRMANRGTTVLSVPNGTTGKQTFPCGEDIFDVDCEGFCNPRIAGSLPDIGADEFDQLVVAGYAPKTTDFNASFPTAAIYMTPRPPLGASLFGTLTVGGARVGYLKFLPSSTPGTRPSGTIAPTTTPSGTSCIDSATILPGYPVTIAMPPVGTPLLMTMSASVPIRHNMQVLPSDSTGAATTLSNLQSFVIR